MQTMYHPISDHVQPSGEVVDLEELRRRRAQAQREQRSWTLDVCASLAVVFMTLVFALRILM